MSEGKDWTESVVLCWRFAPLVIQWFLSLIESPACLDPLPNHHVRNPIFKQIFFELFSHATKNTNNHVFLLFLFVGSKFVQLTPHLLLGTFSSGTSVGKQNIHLRFIVDFFKIAEC